MMMMLLRTASEGFAFMGPDLLPSRLSLRICTNPPPLPGAVAVMKMMMMIMVRMVMTMYMMVMVMMMGGPGWW